MKLFLVLCLVVTGILGEEIRGGYHERVGIPLAAKIQKAEAAAIKSGSRIFGGQPAPLGAHPYMVGLVIHFSDGVSVCGSSMVSNTRAVTAAHCWFDPPRQADMFTLVFGSEYIFYGGVRVDTNDVELHPDWRGSLNPNNLSYDIAIIRFRHVANSNVIQPIALPSGSLETADFVGNWAWATGYGITAPNAGLSPDQVQSTVSMQVITNAACRVFYAPGAVTDKILCTSGVGPVGTCSSDSGGPLSSVVNNQRYLIGLTAFGLVCGGGAPSGFVRITAHLPWIRANL